MPQTIKLTRGIWKVYETEIRKISQRDSLLIICGGCDYDNDNKFVGNVEVPVNSLAFILMDYKEYRNLEI